MKPCHQYDINGNYIQSFVNASEASKALNIDYSNIIRCLTEQQFIAKGYQFKTYKQNKIDAWVDSKKNRVYVYNDDGEFIETYDSQQSAAKAFGVSESSICRYIKGVRKLNGFVFSKIPL